LKKAFDNFLGGRIRDITWTSDSQRLVAVGEGQNQYFIIFISVLFIDERFAKVILVDTGSTVGEVTGHSRTILSCAFSPARYIFLNPYI